VTTTPSAAKSSSPTWGSDVTQVRYEVTGVLTNGRRFKKMTFEKLSHALQINLYRGSVWKRNEDGTRTLLHRRWN